ncbi:21 kDa unknown protein [Oyster mushroom spherical virus]|uniref:21 kDa unknown protein n=1 Tax=Oyster mushroom spherical virus TaxID=218667 RepID=UPI0000005CCD|nr:21 kDa unknown protein [Oyster mushroom spherical virus]AAO26221.1 21 kDa unknown protein [Oyster mushroom spherical virus]
MTNGFLPTSGEHPTSRMTSTTPASCERTLSSFPPTVKWAECSVLIANLRMLPESTVSTIFSLSTNRLTRRSGAPLFLNVCASAQNKAIARNLLTVRFWDRCFATPFGSPTTCPSIFLGTRNCLTAVWRIVLKNVFPSPPRPSTTSHATKTPSFGTIRKSSTFLKASLSISLMPSRRARVPSPFLPSSRRK